MRRYLLVLVTIAVALSLALVGCVGAPAGGGDQGGTTPQPTPTTPTFTPKPTESKILLGTRVKFDWSGWTAPSGFIPQGYNFYYVAGATGTDCCTKEPKWGDPIPINFCCPATDITVNQCGCFWWKVEACGIRDGQPATVTVVSPRYFCVVPGFVVKIMPEGTETAIATGTVKPGVETLELEIDACSLPATAVITIESTALTLCATTTFAATITSDATPYFAILPPLPPSPITWPSGASNPLASATLTTVATVCSSLFGQTIATLTFTVFPDEGGQCPTVPHCCKTVYKVNIILKGEEPEVQLWSPQACPQCATPTCNCGWLALKLPTCLASLTDLGTITIYMYMPQLSNSYAVMYYIFPSDKDDFKVMSIENANYKYLAICLTNASATEFATALTKNDTYYIDIKKGGIKFTNGNVTFGWPCEDLEKEPFKAK